jgi:hypothetical protein
MPPMKNESILNKWLLDPVNLPGIMVRNTDFPARHLLSPEII